MARMDSGVPPMSPKSRTFYFDQYTEMNSRFGNLARRRPEFEPVYAAPKQHNLNKLCDAGGLKYSGCPT